MRTGPLILAALVALLIQTSIIPLISYRGIHADLILVLVALSGLDAGTRAGLRTGLIMGAAQDLLWGRYLGLFAGTRALAGFAVGAIGRRLYRDKVLMPFAVCLVATWIAEAGAFGALWTTGVRLPPLPVSVEIVWPASIMNGILAVLVYQPWKRVVARFSA